MLTPTALLALLLLIGFLAQWLAWRVQLPAILFLLLAGLLLGPVSGLLNPDKLFGKLLFPLVSLAIAVVLFEGSLGLRWRELRGLGHAVRRLVTYGALITVILLAIASHWIAGLSWELALLFGTLVSVTGPTVVVPMLRSVRPTERVATLLRWEGIVIDPIGALAAVLVFEAAVIHAQGHALTLFAYTLLAAGGIGIGIALVFGWLLHYHWIPDYLRSYAALTAVTVAFVLSSAFAHESGLLAVTLMGITLGNWKGLHLEDILDFKESLSTLLISMLFIVLAARLPWPIPIGWLLAGLGILLVAQFVVRPLSVWVATLGSSLSWRERLLAGWIAPRGIVAAAISALFALRLQKLGISGADLLVPLVFIMIVGTVALQSATARWLAQRLGVQAPPANGVLILGSGEMAQVLAGAFKAAGLPVIVADDNWEGLSKVRMLGLRTYFGNPTSQHAERHLDLDGIGILMALSTQRERNALACLHFTRRFGRNRIFLMRQGHGHEERNRTSRGHLHGSLQGNLLVGMSFGQADFVARLRCGWRVKSTRLSENFKTDDWLGQFSSPPLPLFALGQGGRLRAASNGRTLTPRAGETLIALVPPESVTAPVNQA